MIYAVLQSCISLRRLVWSRSPRAEVLLSSNSEGAWGGIENLGEDSLVAELDERLSCFKQTHGWRMLAPSL